jgi:hypothetical protein
MYNPWAESEPQSSDTCEGDSASHHSAAEDPAETASVTETGTDSVWPEQVETSNVDITAEKRRLKVCEDCHKRHFPRRVIRCVDGTHYLPDGAVGK